MSRNPDVLILGAGAIGCALGYELSKAGVIVTLVERGEIGAESSSAAAGMLYPLVEEENPDFSRLCIQARGFFPDYLHELHETTGQQVEWHQDGALQVAQSENEVSALRSHYLRYADAGLGLQLLTREEVRDLEPQLAGRFEMGMYFPGAAHLDNARYTQVLAQAATLRGAEIRVNEEVQQILVEHNRAYGVKTSHGEIHAGHIINCMGAWAATVAQAIGTRVLVSPVRGQMIALKAPTAAVGRLVFSPECYLVPRNHELLVGATVEWVGYDKRNTAQAIQQLLSAALALAPELRSATFSRAWSGLRPGTPDSLPIIGEDPACQRLIYATGHFRNGILLSVATAKLVTGGLLQTRTSYSIDSFSPARFHASTVKHSN